MPTVALLGFLHVYADLDHRPAAPTVLALRNPHVARSVLAVDGEKLGEVAPLAEVVVRGLPAGVHTIGWTTPAGFTRLGEAASVEATALLPAR